MRYNVRLVDLSTGERYELEPLSYQFTEKENFGSRGQFNFSYEQLKILAKNHRKEVLDIFATKMVEMTVLRNDEPIYLGVPLNMEITSSRSGIQVSLPSIDYFGILSRRVVGVPVRKFTDTDAGTIAWTIIDENQDSDPPYSDLGITQGLIEATKNRDRTLDFRYIGDTIVNMSKDNLDDGFDFYIDFDKKFNVLQNRGTDRPNVILKTSNIASFSWNKDMISALTNKVYVIGEGMDEAVLYETVNADNSYKSAFKLLEHVLREPEIITSATLIDKGRRHLDEYQSKYPSITIEHFEGSVSWSDYNLGDTIRLSIPEIGIANQALRVRERTFRSDGGAVNISVKLEAYE